MRVAAAQYPLDELQSLEEFGAKAGRWVAEAAAAGARLLLFPEYASLELSALFGPAVARSLPRTLESLQTVLPDYLALYGTLARRHGVWICAGSFPVRVEDGRYNNRSYLFSPDGAVDFQAKLQMTRFEAEIWDVAAGSGLTVFETAFGRLAISICYDSEFPLLARRQVELGAEILLVPSCTDTLAGYNRVRIGCRARALENQCYVLQSPTVGDCAWSEAMDCNVGAAGIYGPVDRGFPADGVLAAGTLNAPQWVYADLDLDAIARVRREGQVLNHRDWDAQFAQPGIRGG